MEAGQRISAEIGLKTAGGARDTDSDTNWREKKGVGRRERRRAGESQRDEQTRLRRGDCEELNATLPTDTQQRGGGGGPKKPHSGFPPTQLTMDCSTSSIPPHPTPPPTRQIPLTDSHSGAAKKTILLEGRAQKKKKKNTSKEKSTLTSSVGQPKQTLCRKSWRSPSMPPSLSATPHRTTSVCES